MATRDTGTDKDGSMFFATAFCMAGNGVAVPAGAGNGAGAGFADGAAAAGAAAAAAPRCRVMMQAQASTRARSQLSPPCGGGRERSLSWGAGAPPATADGAVTGPLQKVRSSPRASNSASFAYFS